MQSNTRAEIVRQPIIAVLGHVDHGKTSVLDVIRKTNVHKKEHGAITQHIGASEVPSEVIKTMCAGVIDKFKLSVKVPGLLFIDTPGHEAFTHLRERGSSIADFAVLVIDVMQGIQKQTIESISIMKEYKTPFLVAANKIDVIPGWLETGSSSFLECFEQQNDSVQRDVEKRIYDLVGKLGEQGFNSDRFDRVKDFTKEIAIVPVSAKTGTGIGELLLFITAICQKFLGKRLMIDPNAPSRGTIIEVVDVKGLGTTMNLLIYDGQLNRNDTIIFPSKFGIVRTKVKALLKPKPLTEIRQAGSSAFFHIESVVASAGVKIIANELADAIPGGPVIELTEKNEVLDKELIDGLQKEVQGIFLNKNSGVVVKADTLGSLQALVKLLSDKGIEISSSGIGSITKDDIARASSMASTNPDFAVILAFHIGITDTLREDALKSGVTIINSMIIYEVIDKYVELVTRKKQNEKQLFMARINLPCKLLVLRNCCFRMKKPCIFGIRVLAGELRAKDKLMASNLEVLGEVKSIQKDKESIQSAKPGDEVAISIDEISYGSEIEPESVLYGFYNRESFLYAAEHWDFFTTAQKGILSEIGGLLGLSHFLEGKSLK